MSYTLSTLEQIVSGNQSPIYFPLTDTEQLSYYQELSAVPTTATRQIYARFKKYSEDQKFAIHTAQARLLDQYHLPVFLNQKHTIHSKGIEGETLFSLVLEHFSLQPNAVIEWYHWQDEQEQTHLQLYARYPLEALSTEERRYHFFQCLLIEQVASVQQQMSQYVHQATTIKKARKYVRDHLQTLLIISLILPRAFQYELTHPVTGGDAAKLHMFFKVVA